MLPLLFLSEDWQTELANGLRHTHERLIISSPYITLQGANFIVTHLSPQAKSQVSLRILTDLSPVNICQGSTDPAALKALTSELPQFSLFHLPKLHAKVYVTDEDSAIVTSANLTAGGLQRNYEYGVKLLDKHSVRAIAEDITSYSDLGAMVSAHNLENYSRIANRLRATYTRQQKAIAKSVKREFEKEVLTAEDELVRLRLAGGAMHTVFAKTILYLLKRYGPLSTKQLHPKIQAIHPDLCDNTVDRVIDGKHFGKKWKHAVRTAQQQLKKRDLVFLSRDRWKLCV
jgi:phosphatidylserine/phosphatidylglycerophosphate/cardiolipin synthase-like enzyme